MRLRFVDVILGLQFVRGRVAKPNDRLAHALAHRPMCGVGGFSAHNPFALDLGFRLRRLEIVGGKLFVASEIEVASTFCKTLLFHDLRPAPGRHRRAAEQVFLKFGMANTACRETKP
jgi:hypothetical protein